MAKQFSAQKAAGRLESKQVMKQAFYADLFRMIFQLKLAYADEPRPVVAYNDKGEKEYRQFSRWDFLKQDDAGQWYWNDRFLFSCDSSAPLAGDREKLWQENRMGAIADGKAQKLYYHSDVAGKRGRIAFGLTTGRDLLLYCSHGAAAISARPIHQYAISVLRAEARPHQGPLLGEGWLHSSLQTAGTRHVPVATQ